MSVPTNTNLANWRDKEFVHSVVLKVLLTNAATNSGTPQLNDLIRLLDETVRLLPKMSYIEWLRMTKQECFGYPPLYKYMYDVSNIEAIVQTLVKQQPDNPTTDSWLSWVQQ